MTRVLIDTHVFLWMQTDPERLGGAIDVLEDSATAVHLSAASSWEISIKWSLGKLRLPESPITYIPDRMLRARIDGLPVQHRHAVAVAELPLHHRDPFDRLLVAQAMVERIPLVTADPAMRPYPVQLIQVAVEPRTQ
jgi:PIN domain nuclease of toxin-antitoxin system